MSIVFPRGYRKLEVQEHTKKIIKHIYNHMNRLKHTCVPLSCSAGELVLGLFQTSVLKKAFDRIQLFGDCSFEKADPSPVTSPNFEARRALNAAVPRIPPW